MTHRSSFLVLLLAIVSVSLAPAPASRAAEAQVTVHLLDHTGKSDAKHRWQRPIKGDKKPRLWIDWCENWRNIEATKVVTGAEAEKLTALLKKFLPRKEALHFCGHDPIYGIEARNAAGQTVLKTSICFTCGTWVEPGKRYDITGKPGIANPLCLRLRKVIELPESVLKAARK